MLCLLQRGITGLGILFDRELLLLIRRLDVGQVRSSSKLMIS